MISLFKKKLLLFNIFTIFFLNFIHTTQAQYFSINKKDDSISLVVVGDIMLSRVVARKIKKNNDINYPFLKVSNFIKKADIAFANLENPITEGKEVLPYKMLLRADIGVEKALKDSGFDVLSLANNHLPDFGEKGILDTIKYLDQVSIFHTGAGINLEKSLEPIYITKKDITIAFLAYNDSDVVPDSYQATNKKAGTAFMNLEYLKKSIKKAKDKADLVIISIHSGTEYTKYPNSHQKEFAHYAIDNGADLVIGTHPHVIQTFEKYKDKYIFYSLGNFIFDQNQSDDVNTGLVLEFILNKKGISRIHPYIVDIKDFSQPDFKSKEKSQKIIQEFSKLSKFTYNKESNTLK